MLASEDKFGGAYRALLRWEGTSRGCDLRRLTPKCILAGPYYHKLPVPVREIFQLFIFIPFEGRYKLYLCMHLATVYVQV